MKKKKAEKDLSLKLYAISYNIQSLGKRRNHFKNLQALRKYLSHVTQKPHVIALQETYLGSQQSDESISIDGYRIYRCDDNPRRAGVLTYVREDLPSREIHNNANLQLLIVNVTIGNRDIQISNCYRRQRKKYRALPQVPSLTSLQYIDMYTKMHKLYTNLGERLLIGDFNIETSTYGMPRYIERMCDELQVVPSLNQPTTRRSKRCIDNQFCSNLFIKLIQSLIMHNPWENPSSPHGIIHNQFYYPPMNDDSSAFTATARPSSTDRLDTIPECSSAEESSASSDTNVSYGHTENSRTSNNLSNNFRFSYNPVPLLRESEDGTVMVEIAQRDPIRFVENPIVRSRIQLDPRIVASPTKPNIRNNGLKNGRSTLFQQKPFVETSDESVIVKSSMPKTEPRLPVERKSTQNSLPKNEHTLPSPTSNEGETELLHSKLISELSSIDQLNEQLHKIFNNRNMELKAPPLLFAKPQDAKHTLELSTKDLKLETTNNQKPALLTKHFTHSQPNQIVLRMPKSLPNAIVSKPFSTTRTRYHQLETMNSKFGGIIKTRTIDQFKFTQGPMRKTVEGIRFQTHQNPFFIKKTVILKGKNYRDSSHDYEFVAKKYSVAPPVKAAAKAGVLAALDQAIYGLLATDKGRPTLKQGLKQVCMATVRGFINSAVPGGEFVSTLVTAGINGDYENLPMNLLRTTPSVIPGNPIQWTYEHTQANAPLFGSDLRSDNVKREAIGVTTPFLTGLLSVGLCRDTEQIQFSRNGVNTLREADAVQGHVPLGSVFDASLGFSSGTEMSEPVTHTNNDGMTRITYWKKEFVGQFGTRIRVADRKYAEDIGSTFNKVSETTTVEYKTDRTPITVRNDLPLTHLTQEKYNLPKDQGIISEQHELYVKREMSGDPMINRRIEKVFVEKTITKDDGKAYGLWSTKQETTKHDIYTAEEIASRRYTRELPDEIETNIVHQYASLSGQDQRESSEKSTKYFGFSSKENVERYEPGEKRDKEIVQEEKIDITQVLSKKDETPYDVRKTTTATDKEKSIHIEKDYYKKKQHIGTNDEIDFTIGQAEKTTIKRQRKGALQPEVINSHEETRQVYERGVDNTKYEDVHWTKTTRETHKFGLFTNTITQDETIVENGIVTDKPQHTHTTLSNAASNGLTSTTTHALNLGFNHEARTKQNALDATTDVAGAFANGWAHSNMIADQNSPASVGIALAVTLGGATMKTLVSLNSDTQQLKELSKGVLLSSAPSVVSAFPSLDSRLPVGLKTHSAAIVGLSIRTAQIIQDYWEKKIDTSRAIKEITRQITGTIINSGIQASLVPQLLASLSLTPLGTGVAIAVTQGVLNYFGISVSPGLLSNLKRGEEVIQITEDGMTEIIKSDKQFSNQLEVEFCAGKWRSSLQVAPAFTRATQTTTIKYKTDETPITIRNDLPLTHLAPEKDNLLKDQGIISGQHEHYIKRETSSISNNGRVEWVYDEVTSNTNTKQAFGLWSTVHATEKHDRYAAEENASHRSDRELPNEIETIVTHRFALLSGKDLRENSEKSTKYFGFSSKENVERYEPGEKRDKETVQKEWTNKKQITSQKNGTPYKIFQEESTFGRVKVKRIIKNLYKKTEHLETTNEIFSTISQTETIATKRIVIGIIRPEITTIYHEIIQTSEQTLNDIKISPPLVETKTHIRQKIGLLINKTTHHQRTFENGTLQAKNTHIQEILSDAASYGFSSTTTHVLSFCFNPEARTKQNALYATTDIMGVYANGWTHSNMIVNQNSLVSVGVALGVTVGGAAIKTLISSNRNTMKIKEVLLSSASSVVSIVANASSWIPMRWKARACALTSLAIRIERLIQDYKENRVDLLELIATILQELTSAATVYYIQACIPELLQLLLPLDSLPVSVITCITVAAMTYAVSSLFSSMMNKWRAGRYEKEFSTLCEELDLSPSATDAEIDSKYRRLALKLHPDKTKDDGSKFKKLTKQFQRFHELRLRYNISSDRSKTQKIIERLRQFLKDPMAFILYFSHKNTTSTASTKRMLTE